MTSPKYAVKSRATIFGHLHHLLPLFPLLQINFGLNECCMSKNRKIENHHSYISFSVPSLNSPCPHNSYPFITSCGDYVSVWAPNFPRGNPTASAAMSLPECLYVTCRFMITNRTASHFLPH